MKKLKTCVNHKLSHSIPSSRHGVFALQSSYLKLILPSHKLTAVNSQSSGALLPITRLKQDKVKIRKSNNSVWREAGSKWEQKFIFDNCRSAITISNSTDNGSRRFLCHFTTCSQNSNLIQHRNLQEISYLGCKHCSKVKTKQISKQCHILFITGQTLKYCFYL